MHRRSRLQPAIPQAGSKTRVSAAELGHAQQHRRVRGAIGMLVDPRPGVVHPPSVRHCLRLVHLLALAAALPQPLAHLVLPSLLELRRCAEFFEGLGLEVVQQEAADAVHPRIGAVLHEAQRVDPQC